jgi:hypothetical protein
MAVALRALEGRDLDAPFEWEREPRAVAMAAFTRAGLCTAGTGTDNPRGRPGDAPMQRTVVA